MDLFAPFKMDFLGDKFIRYFLQLKIKNNDVCWHR